MNSKRGNSLIQFFGLNTSIVSMLFMVICIGLGEKMAERFLPLYLLALGGSTLSVGFLNALDNLLGALYSFPGGYLSEKLGYKRALQVFTLVAMFGYLIVIFIPAWQAVMIGSVFFIAWTAVSLPAIMSMVAKVNKKDKRTMGVTVHSFVRRIPMALGPVLGGLMIGLFGTARGVRLSFVIAFALGVLSLVFIQLFMQDDKTRKAEPPKLWGMFKHFDARLRNLLVSDILISFAEQIPYAFVVIWVVKNNGLSELQFGILTTVEMATAMLVYIPVAYFADRSAKKPFVVMTFCFFTAFPLVLLVSRTFWMLVFAFVIRGLKEFGEPTRKALIIDLAPEHLKAGTFGTYYLIRDVIVSIAALSSAYLWNISPATNFIAATACGAAGTLLFALFGKDLTASREPAAA